MTVYRRENYEVIKTGCGLIVRNNKGGHAHFAEKYINGKLDLRSVKFCVKCCLDDSIEIRSEYFKKAVERLRR